jgi:hypothetical protein
LLALLQDVQDLQGLLADWFVGGTDANADAFPGGIVGVIPFALVDFVGDVDPGLNEFLAGGHLAVNFFTNSAISTTFREEETQNLLGMLHPVVPLRSCS